MNSSQDICSPYPRKTDRVYTRIVLLKRYRWPDRDATREMPGYDGRGASTALLLAAKRCVSCADVYRPLRLDEMALEQIEREQAREREAAE